jgi:hypothetical protein
MVNLLLALTNPSLGRNAPCYDRPVVTTTVATRSRNN